MTTSSPSRTRIAHDAAELRQSVDDHLYFTQGAAIATATPVDRYNALAFAIRDILAERRRRTTNTYFERNEKFVYYLSAEYLLGKQLEQNLLYTNTLEAAREALADYPETVEEMIELENEPGLGNGGLGRLAACFLESLATMGVPAVGYGIRYEYGIFRQTFVDGWQVEQPDAWLSHGNPWEFEQTAHAVDIGFGGHTEAFEDAGGHFRMRWVPGETVRGVPYTMMVPGYGNETVNIMRLWRARATDAFDFQRFDAGDYALAVEQKVRTENISKVLYPNDNTPQGRELRLRQQYFFVACSLRDIIRRFHLHNSDWAAFPDKVVIQLNDTHPVIGIPELMRILIDEQQLTWDEAWAITNKTFAYTCHTLLPEALETWPVSLFESLLPRHLQIIYEINQRFLDAVRATWPGDEARVARMSIIDESNGRRVRMANLATVGSFSINGVAELHSHLLQAHTLRDFAEMYPQRFNNKTNGITPRRFVRLANPRLSALISSRIGDGWVTDLEQLRKLEPLANDAAFRRDWRAVKLANKEELADLIGRELALAVDPHSIFDVMIKRLHEYKRQLLNVLHIIALYQRLHDAPGTADIYPRTFIFGAKAAPGYWMAKLIIRLINGVADVVNHDPISSRVLRVAYLPNFNVSLAQRIYPAADISEQISMAGKEASGTGNMKFALNGALTTGTLDGANVEIRERVGAENFFLFGLTADEVFAVKANGYNPLAVYRSNPALRRVIDAIAEGVFSHGDRELFRPIVNALLHKDEYLLMADYQSYIDCQSAATAAYIDRERWTRMSILNAARCGFFSSDRSMRQYCDDIWHVNPVKIAS